MSMKYIVRGMSDDEGDAKYWQAVTQVAVRESPLDSGMKKRLLYANQKLKLPIIATTDEAAQAVDQLFTGSAA